MNNIEVMTPEKFTPDRTRELLAIICGRVGLDPADATLLRHQTNAVYQLKTSPVVVKIARPDYSVEHIHRTVELTQWLTRMDFPTLPLLDIEQPLVINGSAVTFWPYLPQNRPIETGDIAKPLRQLHELSYPPIHLRHMDAVAAIRYSLSKQKILSRDEHDTLVNRCERLATALAKIQFDSNPQVIHGDPQHGNTLWNGSRAVLCDWDSTVLGNPEWDLVTIEVHHRRFNHDEISYGDFCRVYGRDIREWGGYSVLRDLRELRMISTNARKSARTSPGAAEVHRRVAQIVNGEWGATWSIL